MKKQFKTLTVLLAALTMGLTGCSKDDPDGNIGGGNEGKETTVQIKVSTSASASTTRAGVDDMGPTTGKEGTLATNVYVFVFRENGTFEYAEPHTLDGDKKTPTFKITEGTKYFYVFSDPADVLKLNTLASNTSLTREGFEKTLLTETSFASSYELVGGNETAGFVNGTLWGKKELVSSTTQVLRMNIGRIVGKVTMKTAPSPVPTKMKGIWSNYKYSIGSVALKTNFVGQYEGNVVPPGTGAGHGAVTSAVHGAKQGNGTDNFAHYSMDYNDFKAPGSVFYVNENTTTRQDLDGTANPSGNLFYGNTTYVRFSAVYAPAMSEYCKPADGTAGGSAHGDGKSYYTAVVDGKVLVFGAKPTVPGATDIKFYKDGINFFRFPVRDRDEDGLENQCRVLRNHWYSVGVNRIDAFGEPGGDKDDETKPPVPPVVPPTDPIEEEIELKVEVQVLKWATVDQDEEL